MPTDSFPFRATVRSARARTPSSLSAPGAHRSGRAATRLVLASVVLAGGVLTLSGCASTSTPVVYPSSSRPGPGASTVAADVERCRSRADEAVGTNGLHARKVATQASRRGAIEFVDRAVEQTVINSRQAMSRARGAAAGAVAGGLTAVALNWNEPDAVYREFVELCMRERGHRVLGWR